MAGNGATVAWAAEMGLITWRDWKASKRFPYPSELLATFVIFGLISVLPDSTDPLGPLLGFGVVLATFVNLFNPATVGQRAAATPAPAGAAGTNIPIPTTTKIGG